MPSIKVRKYRDSVYVIYTHAQAKFKIFTGVKVEDQYWNLCAPKKNCPEYDNVNIQIAAMQTRVMDASMKIRAMGIDPTIERVRHEFSIQLKEVHVEKPFWDLYKEYIHPRTYNYNSWYNPVHFMKVIKQYCTGYCYEMNIDTWDQLTFRRLIQYLLFEKIEGDDFIIALTECLKTFMECTYPLKDLSWMKYDILPKEEVVALTEGELQNLIDADLGGYLEETRDLFVFLATSPTRYHESQLHDPKWATEKDILKFQQIRINGVYPPLFEVSRRILIKYYQVPPQIEIEKFNVQLKELFEELKLIRPVTVLPKDKVGIEAIYPLSEVVCSDTARKTFISLCLLKGMNFADVMLFSDHSDYRSMRPYIRFFRQHLRMEADKLNDLFGVGREKNIDPLNK